MPRPPTSPALRCAGFAVQLRLLASDWRLRATYRIETTPALAVHKQTLLSDWPAVGEHWRWLATAYVDELVGWALFVEQEPAKPHV